jgi:tetratricopeptide (TPR) repeat protein
VAFLAALIALSTWAASPLPAIADGADILRRARLSKDPLEKIRLLDEALADSTLGQAQRCIAHLERGRAHKAVKDYYKAVEDFNSCLTRCRALTVPLQEKAETLILLDQYDEASQSLERALLISPTDARSYELKGEIYEKEGFLSKAEGEYTRALFHNPLYSVALEKRSRVRLKLGRPSEALADIESLCRLEPKRADLFITKAGIHVGLGEFAKAIDDYDRAGMLGGDPDAVVKAKVKVLLATGDPKKALETLRMYREGRPDDVEACLLQARAHILLSDLGVAEKLVREASALAPANPAVMTCSGVLARKNKQWDRALADLNAAILFDPSLAEAFKERARVFAAIGEDVRAIADLTKAVSLDPSDGALFAERGRVRLRGELCEAAISDFTTALARRPSDSGVLYDRAVAYCRLEDWNKALTDIDEVLRINPQHARAYSLRGAAHCGLGRLDKARLDFDKSVALAPRDHVTLNNRGFFFFRTGLITAAIEDFDAAVGFSPDYERARVNKLIALKSLASPGVVNGTKEKSEGRP